MGCLILVGGCALKWAPALEDATENRPTPTASHLLDLADHQYNQAADRQTLLTSIEAYENVLKENPGNYTALVQLSNQYILMGTAYTQSRHKKSAYFHQAMKFAELAMYSNEQFRERIKQGKALWEAAGSLGKDETEAMFFWVTALQYEFKEGMTLAGKIRNIAWMKKCLVFLDRIEKTNPDFGDGGVEFAKFICYYVLPKSKGGSKKTGELYLKRAVAKGKKRLLPRWGRGKYYYPIIGDKVSAREDLAWVADQDLRQFKDPYPWRVHFQKNARELLY